MFFYLSDSLTIIDKLKTKQYFVRIYPLSVIMASFCLRIIPSNGLKKLDVFYYISIFFPTINNRSLFRSKQRIVKIYCLSPALILCHFVCDFSVKNLAVSLFIGNLLHGSLYSNDSDSCLPKYGNDLYLKNNITNLTYIGNPTELVYITKPNF